MLPEGKVPPIKADPELYYSVDLGLFPGWFVVVYALVLLGIYGYAIIVGGRHVA